MMKESKNSSRSL